MPIEDVVVGDYKLETSSDFFERRVQGDRRWAKIRIRSAMKSPKFIIIYSYHPFEVIRWLGRSSKNPSNVFCKRLKGGKHEAGNFT